MSFIKQSYLFPKDQYSLKQARRYLRKRDILPLKLDKTENYFRFRLTDPQDLYDEGYKLYTQNLRDGVKLIVAFK